MLETSARQPCASLSTFALPSNFGVPSEPVHDLTYVIVAESRPTTYDNIHAPFRVELTVAASMPKEAYCPDLACIGVELAGSHDVPFGTWRTEINAHTYERRRNPWIWCFCGEL